MGKGDRTKAKVTIGPKWRPKRDFRRVLKSVERAKDVRNTAFLFKNHGTDEANFLECRKRQ